MFPTSEPEPDVAVAQGTMSDYQDHPATALLIVEVSDTRVTYDLGRKANLYAAAGIADDWTLNLGTRSLHVYRAPIADPAAEFGHKYSQLSVLDEADHISPLAAPGAIVRVADLLP